MPKATSRTPSATTATTAAAPCRTTREPHRASARHSPGVSTGLAGLCDSPNVHKALTATGAGLMGGSLLLALLLSAVDPAWATEHVTLLVVFGWMQQAALILGAAFVAAGSIVVRLAPPTVRRVGADTGSDWFA